MVLPKERKLLMERNSKKHLERMLSELSANQCCLELKQLFYVFTLGTALIQVRHSKIVWSTSRASRQRLLQLLVAAVRSIHSKVLWCNQLERRASKFGHGVHAWWRPGNIPQEGTWCLGNPFLHELLMPADLRNWFLDSQRLSFGWV